MKKIIFIAIICLLAIACNKSSTTIQNEKLLGKWQLTAYFISPGDGGTWYPADSLTTHTIEFRSDGAFTSSDNSYNDAIGFIQADSARIKFTLPTQIPSELECYFQLTDNGQTLLLSPVGCIEGCSNKYKAVRSINSNN